MKIKYLSLLCIIMMSLVTACNSNASKQEANEEMEDEVIDSFPDEVETVAEVSNYEAPFTIKVTEEELNPSIHTGTRLSYIIEVNKNGTYSIKQTRQRKSNWTNYEWKADGENEFTGRWTVTHRAVGEDYQKVYDLRFTNGNTFVYIPDDLENIWISKNYNPVDWADCANFKMSTATKVAEIETPKGTKVIIPEEERFTPEPEEFILEGKTYGYDYTYDANSVTHKTLTFLTFGSDNNIDVENVYYSGGEDGSDKIDNIVRYTVYYRKIGNTIEIMRTSQSPYSRISVPPSFPNIQELEIEEDGSVIAYNGYKLLILESEQDKYYTAPFFHLKPTE